MSVENPPLTEQRQDRSDVECYRCPDCDATYEHELLTRIHITRSDDEAHKNHDGLMPETAIEALDADGAVVERITRRPDEMDVRSLEPVDLPEAFDERKRRVLLIAAYHPYVESFADLHERATAVLEQRGLEPVSYGTVRRWVREFFMPQQTTEAAEETDPEAPVTAADPDETLDDLTAKQQAVVIHHLADPDASLGEIADRVGCSQTYPSHVYERAGDIIDRLQVKLDDDSSLDELLTESLADETISSLHEDGFLDGLEVDVEDTDGSQDEDTETAPAEPVQDGPTTGSVANTMSASPYETVAEEPTPVDEAETDAADVATKDDGEESGPPTADADVEPENEADSAAPPETDGQTGQPADDEGSPRVPTGASSGVVVSRNENADAAAHGDTAMVPKTDIKAVADRVRFLRRVAEREAGTEEEVDGRLRTQLAVTKELEAELEQLLGR